VSTRSHFVFLRTGELKQNDFYIDCGEGALYYNDTQEFNNFMGVKLGGPVPGTESQQSKFKAINKLVMMLIRQHYF